MRVLIVVPDMVLGGVTTVVTNLLKQLYVLKDDVMIVSLKTIELKNIYGFKIESLNIKNKVNFLMSSRKFAKIIKDFNPDIIHSHTIYPHLIVRLAKILHFHNIKHVCSEHTTIDSSKGFVWYLFKVTNKYSDLVTFVSRYSANSYIENDLIDKNKLKILYNGVDCNYYHRESINIVCDNFKFAYIGRLSKEKNLLNLLQAIDIIKNKVDFKLYIVGDGEQKQELLNYLKFNDLLDKIEFLGSKSDIKPVLEEIDLLLISSDTEGLPMIILEAMSMQCNIVSTECGGIPEIFENLPNFLAKINDPEELALQILNNIMLSENQRNNIGLLYRERILDRFSVDRYKNEIVSIYKSLIS